jgi:Uma2 family endonuclease
MADAAATDRLLTAEELYDMPEDDARYELVEGRLVVSEPAGCEHGEIAVQVGALLLAFVRPRRLGAVMVDSGYVLARGPDTVRGPDVSFVRADRRPAREVAHRFYEGAPDLAVEIVSPSDGAAEVARKVANYLAGGTRAVWVVYPRTRTVVVHPDDGPPRMLGSDDTLDGGAALPGFACPVAEFFPPLD